MVGTKYRKMVLSVGHAASVGAMVYFCNKASSLYQRVRECLDHVDDTSAFEYCKGYPDSIEFHLIGMVVSFLMILVISHYKEAFTVNRR